MRLNSRFALKQTVVGSLIAYRLLCVAAAALVCAPLAAADGSPAGALKKEITPPPRVIGHRGLIKDTPENTLAGFAACLELRVGFELDVRRSRDGHLVCLHDDTVNRTTDGTGKVADLTLAEIQKLDAGRRFDPAFAGQRIPTLDAVFALLHARQPGPVLVAIDLKIDDPTVEADVVRLAVKHRVLDHLICIGRAITGPAVRRKLREANAGTHVAVLVQAPDDLPTALADAHADWIYLRFVPTAELGDRVHRAGKRVFWSGPKVIGNEPENWRHARTVGVDALLTDYPLLCRQVWRTDSAETAIFPPGATLKVEAEGGSGGEGPAWHPELGVLTSGNGHIYQLQRSGQSRIYRKGAGTNGLLFDAQGRLLACEPEQRRITRTERDGTITVLTDRYQGKRYNEPNDLTVDSQGRIYFSDPRYGPRAGKDIRDEQGRIIEGVYRIDADGKVSRVLGREVERPNGVLVSGDDRCLYVADNNNNTLGGARRLLRFDLRKDGSVDLASKRLLYDWGKGRGPDGIKQDQQGRLYVAAGLNKPHPPFEPAEDRKGGIYVFSPEGRLLTFLPVPRDEVTNCAFGGDDLKTLYITAGGTLYSIRTATPGRVVWPPAK
jgi:gluconolactonase